MVTNVLPLLVQLHVMAMRKKMINDNQVMVVGQPYWSFKAPLPQPRLAPAMVVLGGKPLLTGGSYETGGRREEFFPDGVIQYQAEEDGWRTVARMTGRSHHAMVALPKALLPSC